MALVRLCLDSTSVVLGPLTSPIISSNNGGLCQFWSIAHTKELACSLAVVYAHHGHPHCYPLSGLLVSSSRNSILQGTQSLFILWHLAGSCFLIILRPPGSSRLRNEFSRSGVLKAIRVVSRTKSSRKSSESSSVSGALSPALTVSTFE